MGIMNGRIDYYCINGNTDLGNYSIWARIRSMSVSDICMYRYYKDPEFFGPSFASKRVNECQRDCI